MRYIAGEEKIPGLEVVDVPSAHVDPRPKPVLNTPRPMTFETVMPVATEPDVPVDRSRTGTRNSSSNRSPTR